MKDAVILFIFLIVSITTTSCFEKNENPRKKNSVFHCTLNGQYWESDSIQTLQTGICHINGESMEEYSNFIINAYKKAGNNLQIVSLSMHIRRDGYKISYSVVSNPEKLEENISIDYFEDNSGEKWYHSKKMADETNTIVIDNFDEKNKILSGTFEASVYLVNGNEENIVIQDGYFENIVLPLKEE